jgi:hypothetical protein
LPQDDPKRRQPVIDRAFDLLGWRPSVALDKGLQRTIDYFALKLFCHVGEEPIKLLRPGAAIHIAQ